MDIFEYADVIDKQLIITYYPNQKHRFSCDFEHCEIKNGAILRGDYGNGKSINSSINDYVNNIKNKKLVFNAYKENRQEFNCPESLKGIES
jgi:hypothetical protein